MDHLSAQEARIFMFLAEGLSLAAIARQMDETLVVTQRQVDQICRKLSINDFRAVRRIARELRSITASTKAQGLGSFDSSFAETIAEEDEERYPRVLQNVEVKLSSRERELLHLITHPDTARLTSLALGERLGIAETTVKKHLQRLYAKLQVSSRAELVVRATRLDTVVSSLPVKKGEL